MKIFLADEMFDFTETSDQTPDETSKVKLKPLPAMLRYKFLGPNKIYQVIINVNLNEDQTRKLLHELRKHQRAIRYTIGDLKGINPSIFMHHIVRPFFARSALL
jgi:predicted transcriptional regulator